MVERLLTPSKISAWLECSHFLSLRNRADAGELVVAAKPLGSLAELLVAKGQGHETACLTDFENQGRSIYRVPGRNPDETFEEWVMRIGNPLERGCDVIYQMPFAIGGIRGIADFLVRVDAPETGYCEYEPIDAKLARDEGKPGHVLQLCFYADALEALTGRAPRRMHLWLGTGETESLVVDQFRPYWRRMRRQLGELLSRDEIVDTEPEPCDHCEYCEFQYVCEDQWRREDSLVYVANLRRSDRASLKDGGVRTVAALAARTEPVENLHEENLKRFTRQASLQVRTRERPNAAPAFEILEAGDDPIYGHGFSLLPEPDAGDVFFDFEGHPFWTPQVGLFFLAGLYYRGPGGDWTYDSRWAHTLDEQAEMIRELVDFLAERRRRFPGSHVYHYNHTERSSLEALTRGTESEGQLTSLAETGFFVDLYVVAKNAVLVGTESYGLKHLERLANFERRGGIEKGAGAVIEYEEYMATGDPKLLDDIARYNEDDVAATLALREWLIEQRPREEAWRDAMLEVIDEGLDTDELVEELKKFGEDSPEHLLGDLLNYWRRERSANTTPKFVQCAREFSELYDDPDYIANLRFERFEESTSARGVTVKDAVFTWPAQAVDSSLFTRQKSVLFSGVGVERGYGYLPEVDLDKRTLKMRWREHHEELGGLPAVMTIDDYVSPREKPGVLFHLAEQILSGSDDDAPSRVSLALLSRERPRFEAGEGPKDGVFRDDLESTLEWVAHLDGSYVAIQGPPGTGKTYSGSHIIYQLVTEGKRVGITAMSHGAIDNLMTATYEVFEEHGDLAKLRAFRGGAKPKDGALEGVRYSTSSGEAESESYNVVAGTTWLFSRAGMRAHPVDVLIVDEAGQLALADALAAANAARNLVLLGDPLQLSQVSQAEHPGGSGSSVLEHVLGGHPTIPSSDGVFISQTRRMHPDICRFISDQIYEGRLTSHDSCSRQATLFGTGLRWLEVHHEGRSTESLEEALAVAEQIRSMIGSAWTNHEGVVAPLRADDFMVVAPYNDQVRLLRRHFESSHDLAGVQVGTVDKFQGREAPVVFFTMTTSSAEDMPRGPEFLFSRNRLNVAVSRARCLAYLVCTEELLNSRASDLEDMRLISTLSAFVEYAEAHERTASLGS